MEDGAFCTEWMNRLLAGLKTECSRETRDRVFQCCADYHYEVNGMEKQLEEYVGDLEGLLRFLEESYGWIVTDCGEGRLLIDENKDCCVCPVAQAVGDGVSRELCNCSARYAGRMFSKVLGRPVRTEVKRSYLRDGLSCVYEVEFELNGENNVIEEY